MEQFEKLYTNLKKSADILFQAENETYLHCISQTIHQFLTSDFDSLQDLSIEEFDMLEEIYDSLREDSYDIETVRRAFQLLVLFGLKTDERSFVVTPDKIGSILCFFVKGLLVNPTKILDPLVGTGNLLSMISMEYPTTALYGVDFDYDLIHICHSLFEMIDTDISLFYQNVLSFSSAGDFDAIVCDIASYEIGERCTYFPYQLIEHTKTLVADNGFMFLLVDLDFFYHNDEEEKKKVLDGLNVLAFVELPEDLFVSGTKSLLILQKGVKTKTMPFLCKLPSLSEVEAFETEVSKINQWFIQRKEEKKNE